MTLYWKSLRIPERYCSSASAPGSRAFTLSLHLGSNCASPPQGWFSLMTPVSVQRSPLPRGHPNPAPSPFKIARQHINHITRFYFIGTTIWYYLHTLPKSLIIKTINTANTHGTMHDGSDLHTRLNAPVSQKRSKMGNLIGFDLTYQPVCSSQPPMT